MSSLYQEAQTAARPDVTEGKPLLNVSLALAWNQMIRQSAAFSSWYQHLWRPADALEHVGLPKRPNNCLLQYSLCLLKTGNIVPAGGPWDTMVSCVSPGQSKREACNRPGMQTTMGLPGMRDDIGCGQLVRSATYRTPGPFTTTSFSSMEASSWSCPANMSCKAP